jgi:hypothetical protein
MGDRRGQVLHMLPNRSDTEAGRRQMVHAVSFVRPAARSRQGERTQGLLTSNAMAIAWGSRQVYMLERTCDLFPPGVS